MSQTALLVEDSPTQAEFYRSVLIDMGFDVQVIDNGQDALDFAYHHVPDFIILDINLPGMNGIQVCSRLRRDEKTRGIPVIMLTQRDRPEDALEGLQAGAVDYIAKDEFAAETLMASLSQLEQ